LSSPGEGAPRSGGQLHVDEPAPGVARLTISNPAKRGALDRPILDAIATTLPTLDARCVIVTGEGRAFSAGYDIDAIPGDVAEGAHQAEPFATALAALDAFPFPTVAALNGYAIGGGLELAIACDLRIAADGIQLGMPPAKLGVVYSPSGVGRFLAAIGAARTRELFLVGQRIDAATAEAWGLVNRVVEADELAEQALALASEIAANAPLSLSGNKAVIRAVVDVGERLDADTEARLTELRRKAFASEDLQEGLRAFGEKRAPVWRGR
jgi:enoyl-CoA hydratase/carnithine racemase